MCNLYSMTKSQEAVRRLFKVEHQHDHLGNLPAMASIFPAFEAPVVRIGAHGSRSLEMLSWGFVLPQKGKVAKRITNARDDKVQESRFWRSSFETRRCLVPVTSFSEPKGRKPAIWHWFALSPERPLFAFAGLWRSFRGRLKPDAEPVEIDTYAFLTTRPNDVVKPIHPNRMPVMLVGEDAQDTWLHGPVEEAFGLAQPYPADSMTIVHKGETKDEHA